MEIERLPLGQSLADKHRAATLKWRGKPPGVPPEMAIEFMGELRAGSTVRKLTGGGKLGPAMVSYDRFKKHCELHPEWAVEARRISKINGDAGKGAPNRNRTHCINGHSLSEHGRVAIHHEGYNNRQCRACERMRDTLGHPIKPDVLERVTARIAAGASLNTLTTAGTATYLVKFSTLARHRRENPEFDRFVIAATKDNNSKGQKLRWQRVHNATVRDDNNEYYKIQG